MPKGRITGIAQVLEDGSVTIMPMESTLQTAMDLHSAHETLRLVLRELCTETGRDDDQAMLFVIHLIQERHPWLFTDDSSPTPNIAELETMESYYARRLGCLKVSTDP